MESSTKSPIHENAAEFEFDSLLGAKVDAVDICYSIVLKGKLKRILKNISFGLEPGDMCAIVGPSGAGKRYARKLIFLALFLFFSNL